MKKLLIAGVSLVALMASRPADAADMAIPKAPPPIVPVWSWTGFYIGSHAGDAWSRKDWAGADLFFAGAVPFGGTGTSDGYFGGAQAGFNYQTGAIVLGAELEGSFADLDGNARCAIALYICNSRIDAMATLTGRLGLAFDHVLIYAKGGGAYVHDKYLMSSYSFTQVFSASAGRTGWTGGLGVEYAFTSAWSAKVEYDYIGLSNKTTLFTDQFGDRSNITIGQNVQRVKVGVNYKFDWGAPVVARY